MESEFVPLAIYNNKKGEDEEILKRYEEPSWNNPVVRFFEAGGEEIGKRKDRVWHQGELATRIVAALEKDRRDVPAYLALVAEEERPAELERAVFAMPCFWHGEGKLGGLAGVRSTRAAWLGGREVVEVHYDPRAISFEDLVRKADGFGCAVRVFVPDEAALRTARAIVGERAVLDASAPRDVKESDRLYHLGRSRLEHLPLTELQRVRVNAALANEGDVNALLSPRQRELSKRLKAVLAESPDALDGLKRPSENADLATYDLALRRRLETATKR